MAAVDNSWKSELPGWFQQAGMRDDGSVWGYNYSGGYGNLWKGGNLTAEHYGQEGSWGFTSDVLADKNPRIWSEYYNNYPDEPIGDTIQPITSDPDAFEKKDTELDPNDIFFGPEGITGDKIRWTRSYLDENPEKWGNVKDQEGRYAGKGGSPGQPYDPPKEDPNNPYVPAPKRPIPKIDIQIASGEGLQPGILDTKTDKDAAAKRRAIQKEHGIIGRDLETDRRSSGPTLAERLSSLDQTIADTTYTTGDKIKDFFSDIDLRNALKPGNYGDVADVINKGANKVWDTLEAPAQSSSKIKETQDWLWNETAVGRAKDRLLDEPLSTALGWIGQEDKAPAGRKFIDYLLGDTTTKFSQQEIDDTFKGMSTADGIVNTSGGIGPEVYGGEDISQLSYTPDPEGKGPGTVTSKIGYEFQKDVDEATGRYDDNWSQGLNKLSRSIIQPLQGQYATDVGPHLPVIGSPAIQLSRILGGAHNSKQEITGSFDLLSDPMKKAVKDQYNKRQLKSNKAMIGKSKGNIGGRNVYSIPSF